MKKYSNCSCSSRSSDEDLFKPIFKSDEEIRLEREQTQRDRNYESYREAMDRNWNERRKLQSKIDKEKNKEKVKR